MQRISTAQPTDLSRTRDRGHGVVVVARRGLAARRRRLLRRLLLRPPLSCHLPGRA